MYQFILIEFHLYKTRNTLSSKGYPERDLYSVSVCMMKLGLNAIVYGYNIYY